MRKAKAINQDTNLNIRISSDIMDAFRKLSEERGVSASKLYREALLSFLKSQKVTMPNVIHYNGYAYKNHYDHDGGGTYYESSEADWFNSCLDVYQYGEVKCLSNGKLFHVGKLVSDNVVKDGEVK